MAGWVASKDQEDGVYLISNVNEYFTHWQKQIMNNSYHIRSRGCSVFQSVILWPITCIISSFIKVCFAFLKIFVFRLTSTCFSKASSFLRSAKRQHNTSHQLSQVGQQLIRFGILIHAWASAKTCSNSRLILCRQLRKEYLFYKTSEHLQYSEKNKTKKMSTCSHN